MVTIQQGETLGVDYTVENTEAQQTQDIKLLTDAPNPIPSSGVARYKFEQDVTDSWGNNDGTDNTSAGYVTGTIGSYAKDFDGTDDYVQADALDSNIVTPVSVALWVKRNSGSGSNQLVFSHGNVRFTISYEERASNGWECNIFDGNHQTITSGNTTSDVWVHLVNATDGSTMEFFVDGSSVGTTSAGSINSADEKTAFGAQSKALGDYFDGGVDDCRIYDKRLTSSEVSNLYNNGSI